MIMTTTTSVHYLRSGALAGAAAAVFFSVVHHVMISDIWYSLPMMAAVGALCGLCLAWTYGSLFEVRSVSNFLRFNLVFLAMFALLGVASVLVFEPVETMAALIEANEPPIALIWRAMPMTVAFTLGTAGAVERAFWAPTAVWRHSADLHGSDLAAGAEHLGDWPGGDPQRVALCNRRAVWADRRAKCCIRIEFPGAGEAELPG